MEREFSTPSNNNNNYERSIGQCIVLPVDTETPCSWGGGGVQGFSGEHQVLSQLEFYGAQLTLARHRSLA